MRALRNSSAPIGVSPLAAGLSVGICRSHQFRCAAALQPGVIVGPDLVGEDGAVLRRDGEYEQRDGRQSRDRRGKQNGDFVASLQVITKGAGHKEYDRGGSQDGKRFDGDSG